MKKCPNCGSEMESDVNFCTVCGTDIRNIPVESNQTSSEVKDEKVDTQKIVKDEPKQPNESQPNQTVSRVTEAVKNFDKDSLWNWFVTSWKTQVKIKKVKNGME